MNAEIKAKWIEALRSGNYKQGQNKLRDTRDNTFCCLGVLCDLYTKENNAMWQINSGCNTRYMLFNEDAGLPEPIQKWSGINSGLGSYGDRSLASDNDNYKPFNEIADIIEKHF